MLKKPKVFALIIGNKVKESERLTKILYTLELKIQSVDTVGNIPEALTFLEKEKINFIFLFFSSIDNKSGITFKKLKKYLKIPILILCPKEKTADAEKLVSQGAQDFLSYEDLEKKLLEKSILYSIERANNLEALYKSNMRYKFVSKAAIDLFWEWDLVKNVFYRSKEGWKKMSKNEAIVLDDKNDMETVDATEWFERIHREDIGKVEDVINNIIYGSRTEKQFRIEFRSRREDGEFAYTDTKGYILRDTEGNPVYIIGASHDITEQKKTEEELKKLSLIAKETVNAVIITDPDEKIQWVNEAFTRLTEYQLDEVIGKTPGEILQGQETDDATKLYMNQCIIDRKPFECAVINYTKTGRKRWIKIQGQPIFDDKGKLKYFFAMETDITDIKQAEEILKASEEKYRYLFNNNPACIFIWDAHTYQILEVNDNAIEQYGYNREAFLQKTVFDLRLPKERTKISKLASKAKRGENVNEIDIWKHMSSAGQEMYMDITSHAITYKGAMAILALGNNITEKILLEEKLEQERLRKQHEITEAVITAQERERHKIGTELHDNVNQILAGSRLYLSIIKKEVGNKLPLIEETDKLIYSAIQEIRSLSHSLVPPILNYSELIEALDNIIEITTKSGELVIKTDLKGFNNNTIPDKLKLSIYRIVQEQFNNIIKYAKARSIDLKLKNQGKKVMLSIKDDGVGFDTTKRSPGVGLMNIRTRASLFKGEMKIISAPGMGCELIVNFR